MIKIEGMHVFNQVEILSLPWWYFWVVLGIGFPVMGIALTAMDKCKNSSVKLICGAIGIFIGVLVTIFGVGWQMFEQPTGRYEYTVSIQDPNVNVLDFNSKYEIVRKEGELWIIRDK